MASSFQLLDCTFRDGGYYTLWDFNPTLVKDYLSALNISGVKLVELGYKSRATSGFYGLFKYCPESELGFLAEYTNLEFAFMIDVKEFLDDSGQFCPDFLDPLISEGPRLFKWVRLAATFSQLHATCDLINYLHRRGFKTTVNLMGCSLLSEADQILFLETLSKTPVDIFYFADTFGNFLPHQIPGLVSLFRAHFKGKMGFHPHNNQDLAYANTLAAIDSGIDWIDGTVLGMGRGAGNLKIESILLGGYTTYGRPEFNAFSLLDVINTYFIPLQKTHQWGSDFAYMLSGIENIHPTYCQNLKSSHQFRLSDVSQILKTIPAQDRSKYQPDVLLKATQQVLNPLAPPQTTLSLPRYTPRSCEEILIVAGGDEAKRFSDALGSFITRHQPLVIECNHTGLLSNFERLSVFLNHVRFQEFLSAKSPQIIPTVVTGFSSLGSLPTSRQPFTFPFSLTPNQFSVSDTSIHIPDFIVGMYAVGLAVSHQPKTIFLAGFDGTDSSTASSSAMTQFWALAQEYLNTRGITLVSIVPTHYDLPKRSVFSYLSTPSHD